ncbi:MAG: hypothetical protein JW751_20120 [Polyangiaceae bacterium]|nr:hypothetical protein [Polyangiaceae bacterium]
MHRLLSSRLLPLAVALFPLVADAAPRDAAAKKKIDEALNVHYLTTDFDRAESVLLGTLSACEDRCSGPIRAKAWMYIGIVRGSGKNDQAGALEAFQAAIAEDGNVQLDEALATPETIATFRKAKKGGAAPLPSAPPTKPGAAATGPMAPAAPAMTGTMLCLPTVREVQTLRPIPLSCETPQPAVKGVIFYKEFGGTAWKEVPMEKRGTSLQGMVPCAATSLAGKLQVYVEARDATNNVVDVSGGQLTPIEFTILGATNQPPPAYPGQNPPDRCEEKKECPPDFPGCETTPTKEWGDSCASNSECKTGLCASGSCDYCATTADCSGGASCVEGFCKGGKGGATGAGGKYPRLWLGVHGALDIAIVGGKNVCNDFDHWDCFYTDDPNYRPSVALGSQKDADYPYYTFDALTEQGQLDPNSQWGGRVTAGAALATVRALISADYALTRQMLVGGRLGYAFNGGPTGSTKFFPLHMEGRFTYSLKPVDKKGFRPYLHLGAGLGQVDGKVKVTVADCSLKDAANDGYPSWENMPPEVQQCMMGNEQYINMVTPDFPLDAYKRMGMMFVAPGGGVVYAFTPRMGIQANLDLKILFPTTGFAFSPSLGFVYGM